MNSQIQIQTKTGSEPSHASQLQRKTTRSAEPTVVPPIVHDVLRSPGQPLDPATRAFMEPRFGYDFSRVRIHTGPQAAESAQRVSALAYTVGRAIVLGKNNPTLGTRQGQELLGHELTHVVQQGGGPAAQRKNLTMTRPGDTAEREAHNTATALVGGKPFRAPTYSGLAFARALDAGASVDAGTLVDAGAPVVDAGAPSDAGVSGGPRDAGPIAGAPPASPVPTRAPTPAPAIPLTVAIGEVTFRGTANRIAPTRTATVPVTVNGLPTGGSAAIDVEGSGGGNGSATITAGASLTASGTVTVRGDTQTTPGNAGGLRLRATVGSTVVGRSAGFTVAAWPADFTTSRNADIDSGGAVGVAANNAWVSDGSALAELDEVERTERVDIGSRDNPPFTSGSGTSATAGTSSFIAGTASPTTDRHSYGRANIDTRTVAPGVYMLVYRQNFLFNDRRTGVTNRVVQNSGFTITHTVSVSPAIPVVGSIKLHRTVKAGAAVTVEGKATTAGSGTATSEFHTL